MSSAVWSLSGLYLIVSYYKPFEFPTLLEIIFLKELRHEEQKIHLFLIFEVKNVCLHFPSQAKVADQKANKQF